MTPEHYGKVEKGKFKPDNPEWFKADFESLEGLTVKVIANPVKGTRTLGVNRFYFGVIISLIVNEFNSQMTFDKIMNTEEVHELMKRDFLGTQEYTLPNGHEQTLPKGSRKLSGSEFWSYMNRVIDFGSKYLNIKFPEMPGDVRETLEHKDFKINC